MRPYDLVLIGASAGGVTAFQRLLKLLPADFSLPIVIVHHMLKDSRIDYQQVYGSVTNIPLCELEEKMKLEPGKIYFAPPDYHTLIESNLTASLDFSDPVNFSRPSIDVTFMSAAEEFQSRVISILLTGASEDGARGLRQLHQNGSYTMVQEPTDADAPYMPVSALRLIKPHFKGTIEEIAGRLLQAVNARVVRETSL